MANFKTTVLTNKAHELIAKLIAKTADIEFTRVCTSTKDYSALTDAQLESLTEITEIKQSTLVGDVKFINKSSVNVHAAFENTDLTEGYYIRTIALYANNDGEEILYSVTPAAISDFMPPFNGKSKSDLFIDLVTVVSNADEVSIEVNKSAYVSTRSFDAFKEEVNTQLNDMENNVEQLSNPNLLINGDFQVWQRGTTFATNSQSKYSADRWKIARNSQRVEKTDAGIKITITNPTEPGAGITQQIEFDKKYTGSDITLSAKIKNTGSVYFAVRNKGYTTFYAEKTIGSNADWTIVSVTGKVGTITDNIISIEISQKTLENNTIEIAWVKLEFGNVATPFVPRSYGEELALCQRYCQKGKFRGAGNIFDSAGYIFLSLEHRMRTVPTITVDAIGKLSTHKGAVVPTAIIILDLVENGVMLQYTHNSSGITSDSPVFWDNGRITLDAEIY